MEQEEYTERRLPCQENSIPEFYPNIIVLGWGMILVVEGRLRTSVNADYCLKGWISVKIAQTLCCRKLSANRRTRLLKRTIRSISSRNQAFSSRAMICCFQEGVEPPGHPKNHPPRTACFHPKSPDTVLFLPVDVQANLSFFMPINDDISLRRCNDNGLP